MRCAMASRASVIGTPVRDCASTTASSSGSAPRQLRTTRSIADAGPSPAATDSAIRSATTGNSASIWSSRRRTWWVNAESRASTATTPHATLMQQPWQRSARLARRPEHADRQRDPEAGQAPHHLREAESLDRRRRARSVEATLDRRASTEDAFESVGPPFERRADERDEGRRRVARRRSRRPGDRHALARRGCRGRRGSPGSAAATRAAARRPSPGPRRARRRGVRRR